MVAKIHAFVSEHSPQLLILVLVVAFNWTLHQAFFEPTFTSDAVGYLDTAEWIKGGDVTLHPERILKPLAPLGIAILSFLTGDTVSGMLFEAGLMYILLALATYLLFWGFFKHKIIALLGSIILISSYPMLFYGLDLYTETGAMFFYVFALFGIWKYFTSTDRLWFWLSAVAITLGMLWKEYSAVSGVFFGLVILFHPTHTLRGKIRDLMLLAIVSVGVLGLWQWYVYVVHQYSYLDWYRIGTAGDAVVREYTPYHIMKSLFATILLAWAFVPLGLWKWKAFSSLEKRFLVLLILPSLMFLLWGYVSSRLYFIVAPFALFFVLHGFRILETRRSFVIGLAMTVILLGNYAWLFANSFFRAML